MKVRIKKLSNDAIIPTYSTKGDACVDLTAISVRIDTSCVTYHTGLAIEIPEGYVGLLFPRSSVSKKDMILANSVGVIDSGYRGEVMLKFKKTKYNQYLPLANIYNEGDRVGQLMIIPYPHIEFEEIDTLSNTTRGTGGFGSTGQ